MKPCNPLLFLLVFLAVALPHALHARPYDFPTAEPSTFWSNNLSAKRYTSYQAGSMVRVILMSASFGPGSMTGPTFSCGFFCNAPCNAFLFAVFIIDTDSGSGIVMPTVAIPQVVWSANRNRPVRENATIQFAKDGDLILRDVDNTTVWSTNTSGRSVRMTLTDGGNLVLLDKNNASVWSSFDHPTDSLVLGQSLREGWRLTTNVSVSNTTEGQMYLTVLADGLYAYIDSSSPQLYYQNTIPGTKVQNRSTYITFTNGGLELFDFFTKPRKPDMLIKLPTSPLMQYMRLESDGHLRIYEWGNDTWSILDDVLTIDFYIFHECSYPTVCGAYGICSNGQCSCPSGADQDSPTYFRLVDERQSNLGCYPVTPLSCQSIQDHHLLALDNVSYFNYIESQAAVHGDVDEESCKQACLKNCSCKAALYQYGSNVSFGTCFLPTELFSLINNQPDISYYNSSAYIKVQIPPSSPSPTSATGSTSPQSSGNKSIDTPVILSSTLGAVFASVLIISIVVLLLRKRKAREEEEDYHFDQVLGMPTRFSFEELTMATENFNTKLGEGGFGSVFEGTLVDGTKIAVKRLDGIGQGKREFLAEVETIGSIHHINLVRLIGFCVEKSYTLLVYEYMYNGSLDKWIFYRNQNVGLDWQTRKKIIIDIAKGLSYLHEECRQRIAHLDIKPQNILLDDKFNAKVSDFGLAKLIDRGQSQVITRMRGTPGYLAPEWLTSKITEKVDVYSFGIVVMEILCGRKNLDYSQPEESMHLIGLLRHVIEEDCLSDIIDDHTADMKEHEEEVIETMKVAIWCLQSDFNKRPPMSVVVKVLEGTMTVEANLDYDFFSPPLVSQNADYLSPSEPPFTGILSGPR